VWVSVVTISFVVFVAVVATMYALLPARSRPYLLLVASLAFYAYLDRRLPYALAIPVVVDYAVATRIAGASERRRKRWWLALSITVDLALLAYFKYVQFFRGSVCSLLESFGIDGERCTSSLEVALPLGISYFLFKSISAVIDVYRGKPAPARWIDYATYLSFFPQLAAGPIERYSSFGPQLAAKRRPDLDDVRRGVALVLRGLFKKLVVANNIHFVGAAVLDPERGAIDGRLDALFAMYAYLWELYADFSGYTDIANGTASLFGFKPVLNFNLPLFASRPSDFWKRWHVSLSSWVNDYVLYALAGIRSRGARLYAGVLAAMLVVGIWHGPELAFIVYGLYHGLLLVAEMHLRTIGWIGRNKPRAWQAVVAVIGMFHLAVLGELLYATTSVSRAWEVVQAIFTGRMWTDRTGPILAMFAIYVGPLALLELYERLNAQGRGVAALQPLSRGLVYSAMVAGLAVLGTVGGGVMYASF
jgi:D-alanyl-lipoteichoic acid acyltransferase DltB (MBOAT superfamily)